jgi:hypothetical protein
MRTIAQFGQRFTAEIHGLANSGHGLKNRRHGLMSPLAQADKSGPRANKSRP